MEARTFASSSDSQILKAMNGLQLELSGPRTHPLRSLVWTDGDDEWRIVLDEMLVPYSFLHRTKEHGCVFDDKEPAGRMIEQWSFWQEEENDNLNDMLMEFRDTEEGFNFLLAMDNIDDFNA